MLLLESVDVYINLHGPPAVISRIIYYVSVLSGLYLV